MIGVFFILNTVGGCADPGPLPVDMLGGPTNSDPGTVGAIAGSMRADLAVPHVFSVVLPASLAEMTAKRDGGLAPVETMSMPLVGGGLTVAARPDGALVFTAMTLDLGTVTLPLSDGPTVVGVKLSLPGQAAASTEWRPDQDVAKATASADLLLDLSFAPASGKVEAPSTQRIAGVPITLVVAEGKDGRIALTAHVVQDGTFYQSSDKVELSELTVDLLAAD
jgi:hypothetical protein